MVNIVLLTQARERATSLVERKDGLGKRYDEIFV
jgi:hypothetical protein